MTNLFKHALVQDAAYGTLLREPRPALHARIAETLEGQFAETAERQPELLARHCSEAGLFEKAAGLWGKAGQRSLERSALVEAIEQLTRALDQIAILPAVLALRREQIRLQVALIHPLVHVKGYAAPETKAALERARLLIEEAEALGEPPEDPMLLFEVLYGFGVASYTAFNADINRDLAVRFLTLAEKQGAIVPLMIGHRLMGGYLTETGNFAQGRAHYDRAIALYDPAQHRQLSMRFGADARVSVLSLRSWALWSLGYPEAALIDALQWKALGIVNRGLLSALTGKASQAVQVIASGIAARRSTRATVWLPLYLSYLSTAYAELRRFDEAWHCVGEAMTAMETTKETWCEAEVHRMVGEIALMSDHPDATKAETHFDHALAVARQQQAKSWELRAAMSMARLWRDQGKRDEARSLLAPVYGWFTEGFDTRDLKEAENLLDELAL